MKKSRSNLILISIAASLCACSLYRSEGRKNLEDQARDLATNKNFIVEWQCQDHSIQGLSKEQIWEEDGYLHKLTPTQLCISTGPLTGSDQQN